MVFMKQLGVNSITVGFGEKKQNRPTQNYPGIKLLDSPCFETSDLVALREWVESYGLELSGIGSRLFPRYEKILLGQTGRDEQIDNWNKSLRNMGKAGIPQLMYIYSIDAGAKLPIWRTSSENVGRGGTKIVRFNFEVAKKTPLTRYGEISEATLWDSLTYFLKAVIPVAEEASVKMVLHPDDPQVPSLAGIARIIRSTESFDRVFRIMPNKANGMVFCLGCFAQMMDNEHVYKAIKHFGSEGRIGYVHFRGVTGTLKKFDEVFPDEGKLDMLQAVKVLKEVGFNGVVRIDHAPELTGDTEYGHRSHAFQIGYLKGILQGASAME